jgi:protein-S-isoprenylcysteine O-methyltransferase Ste14
MVLTGMLAFAAVISFSVVFVQAAIWLVWLVWLGIIFPHNSRRDSEKPCEQPYRRAFMREILWGISIAFSQFLYPAVTGVILNGGSFSSSETLTIGLWLHLIGGAIVAAGVYTLGVARTLFVHEYIPKGQRVVRAGIYHFVRHPLFLGGLVASLGLAVSTGNQMALELGLLNACVLPVYIHLEDRRCGMILGREYIDYSAGVGSVVPLRRSAIKRAAQLRQAIGRIEPMAGRATVKRR